MANVGLGSTLILLAAATSVFFVLVALTAVFFGSFEEKVLGSLIAVLGVYCTAKLAGSGRAVGDVQIFDVGLHLFELSVSFWIAIRARVFWPMIVAAALLVLATTALAQFLGFPVGVFAKHEIHIGLRFGVALVILWAMFADKKKRDAGLNGPDRQI